MRVFLQKLVSFRRSRRAAVSGRRARLALEHLETRLTPSGVGSEAVALPPAFHGLAAAVTHFYPPAPVRPPLSHSPVLALNFAQYPPNSILPSADALIRAFNEYPPQPIHSPVLVGVEVFLAGGGGTAST